MLPSSIKTEILDQLAQLKGSGQFAMESAIPFIFPRMHVKGFGEVALPINSLQAKALIELAEKTPFGKGSDTIYDEDVRKGWQIDASTITFGNNEWNMKLGTIIEDVKENLGLQNHAVQAQLYKLLIYEEGDFFLTHQDSEKEEGMFGTLIINLPSTFSGGEFHVRFQGEEKIVDFSKALVDKYHYTAFFADCEHEVKKVTSGYRVVLTYNLILKDRKMKVKMDDKLLKAKQMTKLFEKTKTNKINSPLIILLDHQ